MSLQLEKSEIQILKKILDLGKQIEIEILSSKTHEGLIEAPLFELNLLLTGFAASDKPELARLAMTTDHLHPKMDVRHLLNFLIPIERLLDRNLRDDEILITHQDNLNKSYETRPLVFVLHNLRSAFNVGSILRLAETLAAQEVHLVGYTAGPDSDGVKKTAMGTEKLVSCKRFDHLDHSLAILREQKFKLIALETGQKSKSLYEGTLDKQSAFIVGNERFGLDRSAVSLCDEARQIPLVGRKNSLNVASALSVAAFEWHRQQLI